VTTKKLFALRNEFSPDVGFWVNLLNSPIVNIEYIDNVQPSVFHLFETNRRILIV